ncbi:MAG TPA: M23 family metallopeptidase [Spirochaetota bacterium]|nr:M23 family metallopeptidase [Spirochaetota bacterium]HPJ34983.1 M23 family metallopeptidase [Spirochaetota bacterium]
MHGKKLITVLTSLVVIAGLSFPPGKGAEKQRDIRHNARSYFSTEEEYTKFLKNEVIFKNVTMNFVTVETGDNFWKMAKDAGVTIDTLIGANIFWEDLLARRGHEVVVPSKSGVIEFIRDLDDIETLAGYHETDVKNIEVQELPVFYSFYYKLKKERKPIAVFISDAKPSADNMTASLAGKYRRRELFRSPLGGRLSSFFGNRRHPIFRRKKFHNGLDIAAPRGTLIGAARGGVVVATGWNGGYGKAVIIDHGDGYRTLYGHMSVIYAKPGQKVKAGKVIGRVGSTGLSTGPHLHFTIWHNGRLINPMDILW